MNSFTRHILLTAILLMLPALLPAQGESGRQSLMLNVNQLNKIGLTNPSVYLVIDNPPVEGELIVTSNADGALLWTTNGENRKITVTSSETSSRFVLKVLAENVSKSAGTAGPEVTLDDERDHNLIVGVTRTAGRCVLKLTAESSLAAGVASETRTLTYTIMNN